MPGQATSWKQSVEHYLTTKQYASIMPQAIAVWCRQLGHQVFYATYYGQTDPKKLLPNDLDVVFIGCITRSSALSYALAKLYKREKTLTVVGGPHAKSFPHDCLRFFDLVVTQCDKALIIDILSGAYEPNSILSSNRILNDLPSVEERMPEIKASIFSRGKRPYLATMVPLLTSVGCPYTCNFCTDWDNPYMLLPTDHLEADLRYMSQQLPGVKIAFHDPNFAVKFDQTLDVLERIPQGANNPYVVESSLSLLRGPRLQRLRDTNCSYIAPGIESWTNYSNKAGVGSKTGFEKVRLIAEHLKLLHTYVSGIQVNFIFGLDIDEGDEPVEMTKEFMTRTPFVWAHHQHPRPLWGDPPLRRLLQGGANPEVDALQFLLFALSGDHLKELRPDHLLPEALRDIGSLLNSRDVVAASAHDSKLGAPAPLRSENPPGEGGNGRVPADLEYVDHRLPISSLPRGRIDCVA